MRRQGFHAALALGTLLAIAGCGKKQDSMTPLGFAPAETAFVIANIDSAPEAFTARWSQQMKDVWPLITRIYEPLITEVAKKDSATAQVLHAVLDEVSQRDTPEKWREIGFSTTAHGAIYGVGLVPVVRIELADPDAFRAMIARVEQKGGAKLGTARIGDQDVWTFGQAPAQGLLAIERNHLVLTVVPTQADEALKRRVLGLDRPQKSLADSGALVDFNKQRGYLPYGSGWIDTRRVVALYNDDPAIAAFAQAFGSAPPKLDMACRSEFEALAAQAPMFALGYTALDANQMTFHGRLDLAPALAKSLSALPGSMPAASVTSLLDMAFALPILRGRDFLVAQADALAKSPFTCATLVPLNQKMADMRGKLEQMIPPPLADLIGLRVSVSRFAWPASAAIPDVSASVLISTANPAFLTNLAQVSVPALAQLKLEPNGHPVAIPSNAIPGAPANVSLHAAMSANMLGVSVGTDEAPRLGKAVTAASAAPGVLFDMSLSGEVYTLMADGIGRLADKIPDAQREQVQGSRELYAMYAKWFKRIVARMTLTNDGIELFESVQFNP
ncbi:MAG: hypothetical protein ABI748_08635 [Dokdonella sp.]